MTSAKARAATKLRPVTRLRTVAEPDAVATPRIGVLVGSDRDWDVMSAAGRCLDAFGVPYEVLLASAHQAPQRTAAYAGAARDRGVQVLICGAGGAAHLAGMVAAHTTVPVIGVPLETGSLRGVDALLATVQMPTGVPVATVAIGGAENAALLAVQILALGDAGLRHRLDEFRVGLARQVEEKNVRLQQRRRT